MIEPRFVFGLTAKNSEDIAVILETIDELSEEGAESISWTRGPTHRIIVSGPITLRAQLIGEFETVVIRPVGQLQETMDRNDNVWVFPSSYEKASELLLDFKMGMWQDINLLAKETPPEIEIEKPSTTRQREAEKKRLDVSSKRKQSPQIVTDEAPAEPGKNVGAASQAVLAAFGLMGGIKDEDGKEIKLSTLRKKTRSI